jgi:hypothetical protein
MFIDGLLRVCPGQPKRHLLTTGWSLFVSGKRLFAGDSVIFVRYILETSMNFCKLSWSLDISGQSFSQFFWICIFT